MTTLLLRADATPSIGVGHLSRCVAVAKAARARGWDVALCGTYTAGEWLLDDLPVAPAGIPSDVTLIDHYDLDEVRTSSLLVSLEDGEYGRRRADIVIDANLSPSPRPDDGSGLVLQGPAYAPLRPEILAARATRTSGTTPPRVVVVMGGGAAPAAVASAVQALRETGAPATVVAISATPIPNVETIPPTPELPHLLAGADLVVSAAGVTLLELCCIGTPTALVQIADNQAAGYTAAVTQGLAAGLGTNPRDHVETLHTLLTTPEKRKALSQKAMTTVDGQGTTRILTAIETALHPHTPNPPGAPPISSLPGGTDSFGPKPPPRPNLHPPNPNESPTRASGGPPVSNLPGGTDSFGRKSPSGPDVHPPNSNESPTRAPGGPPVSNLPGGTDSFGPKSPSGPDVHPPNPSESPTRVPGGPPVSNLPGTTDNSGPRTSAGAENEAAASESPVGGARGLPVPEGVDGSVSRAWRSESTGNDSSEGFRVPPARTDESTGGDSSEGPTGGAPVSEGVENARPRTFAGDSIGRNPRQSPTRVPGGPPISTLPAGTDNGELRVRVASGVDSGLLFAWRNDSETRAWSRTTDPVTRADHERWLADVLQNENRRLLIIEWGRQPVGTVRFDRTGDHWEVSITVAPHARGRKLSVPILLAAEATVAPATIRACVHEDNRVSLALFERAGYRQDEYDAPWRWFTKAV